jgi:hypothetical protein
MPKAKPVSLHPLSFDEALKAIIRVDPASAKRHVKRKPKPKTKLTKPIYSLQKKGNR